MPDARSHPTARLSLCPRWGTANKVELQGRLTRDPELSDRSGTTVCDMRLAVNGPGAKQPLFIEVVEFKDRAVECAETLNKGSRIEIRGAPRHSVIAAEVRPAA